MNAKSYIITLAIFTALLVMSVVGLNYFVDPYAIMDANRIAGFNQFKSDINKRVRLTKKYQPFFLEHNAIIVGNSRVELGLDPSHKCFSEIDLSVYNLGIPGASVRGQLEYALNVLYQQPVHTIFLGVDFTDFLRSTQGPPDGYTTLSNKTKSSLRFLPSGSENPEYLQLLLLDYYKALFSLDSMVSSIKTITDQSESASDRDRHGFNPARNAANAVSIEGVRAFFEQKMQELEQKYRRSWYLRDSSGRLNAGFYDIGEFLDIASRLDVKVILFTNPFHAQYWSMLERNGLDELHEEWLQELSKMLVADARSNVTFWNFSQDSPYIHEQVPSRSVKRDPLNWFWEPAHYRKELGDLMIDAMMSDSCGSQISFGKKLI